MSLGTPDSRYFIDADGIHLEAFAAGRYPRPGDEPAGLRPGDYLGPGRLFRLVRVNRKTFALPSSSRIMDTGGNKGKGRPLSRKGYLQSCWKYLKVAGYYCVNEYGMTEMASQFYDHVLYNRFRKSNEPRYKIGRPGHARWSSIPKPWEQCRRASTASCVTLTWPTAARSWRFRPMTWAI